MVCISFYFMCHNLPYMKLHCEVLALSIGAEDQILQYLLLFLHCIITRISTVPSKTDQFCFLPFFQIYLHYFKPEVVSATL